MASKLERYLDDAITVEELREMLDDYDDDTKVVLSYNYGDYQRTMVACAVTEVEEDSVCYSDYHQMAKVDEDSLNEDEPKQKVVVIG